MALACSFGASPVFWLPMDDNAHYIIDIKGDWILGPGVPSCRAAGPWRARLARFATGTGVCSVIWVPDALT